MAPRTSRVNWELADPLTLERVFFYIFLDVCRGRAWLYVIFLWCVSQKCLTQKSEFCLTQKSEFWFWWC